MTNKQEPIRVAQVIGIANNGGVESVIINYYLHLDHSKVQFDFFVESTSNIISREKIEALGGKIVIIPSYKNPFKYMRVLKKLFKEGKYDIVHSNMNTLSVFALRAAKKAGIKVRIAHSHSTTNKKEWKKNLLKMVLRPFSKVYATDYFACSKLAGEWLFGKKTMKKGKVTVINNAIELDRFAFNQDVRNKMREELGLSEKFVIGHIGRFMPQKNHSYLIDVFSKVQEKNDNARLLLLGDGPLFNEVVDKVKTLGLLDKVIFVGNQKYPEKYYQTMDCFVMTSLYEGLPVVAVEAQANGLKCYLSSEMTKETKILDTTEFLALSDGVEKWSNTILEGIPYSRNEYRIDNFDEHNILCTVEKLQNKYEILLRKSK